MSFMEIGSALLLLLVLFSTLRKNLSLEIPLAKPVLVFVAIAVVGILLGESTVREKIYDLGRMRFFLLYFILFAVLISEGPKYKWLSVLRVTTFVIGIYGFVQHFIAIDLIRPEGKKVLLYALQDEKIGPLVVGTFNHHLTFSNSYLFFACLFLSLGFSDPKGRWKDLGLGLFLSLLVFWTQSRVAWVALPICMLLLSFFHFGKRAFAISVVGVVALVAGLYLSNPAFQDRLAKTFQVTDHRSFEPRLNLWKAQIKMWQEKPLLGVGWNNNERHSKEYVDRLAPTHTDAFYGHAHSMPLQILATTGVLGLVVFLWIWFGVFTKSLALVKSQDRMIRALGIGALASFVGFWIQGLTQWNFGDAEVIHTVVFFWALVGVYSRSERLENIC